jgi:hypothetical protein
VVFAWGKNLLQWSEFVRSTTLRWTVLLAALFATFVVAILGFVYLKTKHDLMIRYDRAIVTQMGVFAQLPARRRLDAIDENLSQDPGRVRLSGLFGSNGCEFRSKSPTDSEMMPPTYSD